MKCRLLICFLLLMLLCNCSVNRINQIQTNSYIQVDYDYDCLDGKKTFTEIILCYQTQDKAEKAQNKLTNEMLADDTK